MSFFFVALAPIQPEDITDEDKMMQDIMGFNGFDSTKVLHFH